MSSPLSVLYRQVSICQLVVFVLALKSYTIRKPAVNDMDAVSAPHFLDSLFLMVIKVIKPIQGEVLAVHSQFSKDFDLPDVLQSRFLTGNESVPSLYDDLSIFLRYPWLQDITFLKDCHQKGIPSWIL